MHTRWFAECMLRLDRKEEGLALLRKVAASALGRPRDANVFKRANALLELVALA